MEGERNYKTAEAQDFVPLLSIFYRFPYPYGYATPLGNDINATIMGQITEKMDCTFISALLITCK